MNLFISIIAAAAVAFSPMALAAKGDGNNGNGVGNTGPGNQGNSKPVGNAGGNKPEAPKAPKAPKAPESAGAPANGAVDEVVNSISNPAAPLVSTAFILLGFMCERENNREDKTPAVTWFCTEGEMPDAFESYSN